MNQDQFDQLTRPSNAGVIQLSDLNDKTPRTLVYGYLLGRETFHAYIGRDEQLHVVTYKDASVIGQGRTDQPVFMMRQHLAGSQLTCNTYFRPDKRAYGESCDFEFAKLLQAANIELSFTTFEEHKDAVRKEQFAPYAGATHDHPGMLDCEDIVPLVADMLPAAMDDRAHATESMPRMAQRIATEVLRQLGKPGVSDTHYVLASVQDVAALCAAAREIVEQLVESNAYQYSHLEEVIHAILGVDEFNHHSYTLSAYGGIVTVSHEGDIEQWRMRANEFNGIQFEGSMGGYAVLGEYAGRQFLARTWPGHSRTELQYAQFGDPEVIFARWLKGYTRSKAA